MSQLATIFARIKVYFQQNIVSNSREEDYKFFFPLFSLGYTNEDFLFLDSTKAGNEGLKYYDELLDFSLMANNIPRQEIIWQTSGENRDLLYKVYEKIINNMRLIDPESISTEKLTGTPIFDRALDSLSELETKDYRTYYSLYNKLDTEILELLKKGIETGDAVSSVEVELKQKMKEQLLQQWIQNGKKEEVEKKIGQLLKAEAERFIKKFNETKGKLATSLREHVNSSSFYLTTCFPGNLYNSDKLAWTKIEISKDEIQKLVESSKEEGYQSIFELSGLQDLEVDKISFDLIFINVLREWFDEDLLKLPFWDIALLEKENIRIPYFATQLVFARNIEIKLRENSVKNVQAIQKMDVQKNIGPFLLNKTLLTKGSFHLKSVNKTMHLEKKAILSAPVVNKNAGAATKTVNPVALHKNRLQVLNNNQKVLVRDRRGKTIKAQPVTAKFLVAKPMIAKAIFMVNLVNVTLYCRHKETRQLLDLDANEIEIFRNNKKEDISVKKNDNNTLSMALQMNEQYTVKLVADDLEAAEIKIVFNEMEKKEKRARRFIYSMLFETKEQNLSPDNEFQLVAVVCKKMPEDYPSPVPYADYF
ncbi:MAG: hypothetical protein K0B11_05340 [Mariniphaga sp.]|nr:hypothetical protein [Mariniphaga sp.]